MNSTNVRIETEDMRSPLVALAAWALFVALGAADGVFARLEPSVDGALAAFATLFALAACCLDRSVGSAVDRVRLAPLAALALGVDALVALQLAAAGPAALASGIGAFLAFFAAPVAIAAHVALARRLGARLRSRAATSPAGRPAST